MSGPTLLQAHRVRKITHVAGAADVPEDPFLAVPFWQLAYLIGIDALPGTNLTHTQQLDALERVEAAIARGIAA